VFSIGRYFSNSGSRCRALQRSSVAIAVALPDARKNPLMSLRFLGLFGAPSMEADRDDRDVGNCPAGAAPDRRQSHILRFRRPMGLLCHCATAKQYCSSSSLVARHTRIRSCSRLSRHHLKKIASFFVFSTVRVRTRLPDNGGKCVGDLGRNAGRNRGWHGASGWATSDDDEQYCFAIAL
jgi:hypothetical protein